METPILKEIIYYDKDEFDFELDYRDISWFDYQIELAGGRLIYFRNEYVGTSSARVKFK